MLDMKRGQINGNQKSWNYRLDPVFGCEHILAPESFALESAAVAQR
jgi:hypothetical protein